MTTKVMRMHALDFHQLRRRDASMMPRVRDAFSCLRSKTAACGLKRFHTISWWSWLGGVAGAYYVMTVFTAVPLIGAATTVRLTIAGQQLVSMLVDRYGLLRLPQRPISTVRMASVFLLLTGVALIRVF
jgi:transporter family-2 protein